MSTDSLLNVNIRLLLLIILTNTNCLQRYVVDFSGVLSSRAEWKEQICVPVL